MRDWTSGNKHWLRYIRDIRHALNYALKLGTAGECFLRIPRKGEPDHVLGSEPQENHYRITCCKGREPDYEMVKLECRVQCCDENARIIPEKFSTTGTVLFWVE